MKPSTFQRAAFTLIELLVVIVIIAILAAILLPVISRVREQADSTKCSSNMRQIGVAIISYSNEHSDTLPGPLTTEQFPTFQATSGAGGNPGSLAFLLDPYIARLTEGKASASTPTADERKNIFVCPSYSKLYGKTMEVPVYLINNTKMTSFEQSPWGSVEETKEPVKKTLLTSWTEEMTDGQERPVPLSQLWALVDADEGALSMETPLSTKSGGKLTVKSKLAPKPVHSDHRNILYYDFHVGKQQAAELTPAPK